MAFEMKLFVLAVSVVSHFLGQMEENPVFIENFRGNTTRGNGDIEKLVIGVLEEAKALFYTGIPELGIPKLDPFVFDSWITNLEFPTLPLSADLVLQDVYLQGMSNFNITKLNININGDDIFPLTYETEVTFNSIGLVFNYGLNGMAFNEGDFSKSGLVGIELKRFNLSLSIETGTHCGIIILDKFSFGLSLDEASVILTGIKSNSADNKCLSKILSLLLPALITDNSDDLNAVISPQIRNFVNKVLGFIFFEAPVDRDHRYGKPLKVVDDLVEKFVTAAQASPYYSKLCKN